MALKYKPFITSGDYKKKDKLVAKIEEMLVANAWDKECAPLLGCKMGNPDMSHWYWGIQIKAYKDIQLGYYSFKKLVHFLQQNFRADQSAIFFEFMNIYTPKTGWDVNGLGYTFARAYELGGENVDNISLIAEDELLKTYEEYKNGSSITFV